MEHNKNIYCISGLGADQRLFANLEIEGHTLVPLPWVPYDEDDTMAGYATKMFHTIPEADPIVMGLSFGGMLTVEMCKAHKVRHGILVSSAKTRKELGYNISVLLAQSAMDILPDSAFNTPFWFELFSLGSHTDEERKLLRQIISDYDPKFVQWCIKALLSWENTEAPANIWHIHGTADRVITPSSVKPDHWVKGGSHIMVYNRAAEVSAWIAEQLKGL
ncbi:hypothetical protein GCM10023093_03810 [Nemorincola caseinilytica]|uniref:AB hydrolase-1 domain-containing protein n=1 Tax=Nemorincola caseinilytica TaxID=2054315 RepID=A0ABP8N7W5_9BACT